MQKRIKQIIVFLLSVTLIFACAACTFRLEADAPGENGQEQPSGDNEQEPFPEEGAGSIDLNEYSGSTVDLCMGTLREYLELEDPDLQAKFLYDHQGVGQDEQAPVFSWKGDGSEQYTVFFADNSDFENAVSLVVHGEILEDAGFFLPGKTYYWKVQGDSGVSDIDTFCTENKSIRIIEAEGACNIRDLGGWNTEDGRTVKYGMIYRGGQLNGYNGMDALTDKGKYVFNEILKMNTEIDLRTAGRDDGGQTSCWWNKEAQYVKIALPQYSRIIPEYKGSSRSTVKFQKDSLDAIKRIITFLSDESNYPVYIHCNAGADRTGTLAFLIGGLLGVSYEDLTRDFETTSFTYYGARWRSAIVDGKFSPSGIMRDDTTNFIAWGEMYSLLMENYAGEEGTLSSAVENYLVKACGVDTECIDAIRGIMLE